jgi:hypothetical protein
MAELVAFDEGDIVTVRINIRSLQIAAVVIPFAYMLLMMRIGAIRFPYWDHLNTAKQIIEYFDGSLSWASMLEPQSQGRPLIPRLVFVGLAALTRWDIRAEFVVLVATFFGVLAFLLRAAWQVTAGIAPLARVTAFLLISVLVCSPVGAHNQIWSLMLIATLSYLSTTAAFVLVALHRQSWAANTAAAALAWIATYCIGQGLFIFPLMAAVHQLTSPNRLMPNRFAVFWFANLVACYALFLLGLPTGSEPKTLINFVAFILVYIGNPLGELIWYPFNGAIDLPYTLWINLFCGTAIAVAALFTTWRALREPRSAAGTVVPVVRWLRRDMRRGDRLGPRLRTACDRRWPCQPLQHFCRQHSVRPDLLLCRGDPDRAHPSRDPVRVPWTLLPQRDTRCAGLLGQLARQRMACAGLRAAGYADRIRRQSLPGPGIFPEGEG